MFKALPGAWLLAQRWSGGSLRIFWCPVPIVPFLCVWVLTGRCLSSCFHSSKMMPAVGLCHVGTDEVD